MEGDPQQVGRQRKMHRPAEIYARVVASETVDMVSHQPGRGPGHLGGEPVER